MTAHEIKVALLAKHQTLSSVARDLRVTPAHVSMVVNRKRQSGRIEAAIAKAIGKPVARVFGRAA